MPPCDPPSGSLAPEALEFGCPACQGVLSVPMALSGVEGPCPLCGVSIVAPTWERPETPAHAGEPREGETAEAQLSVQEEGRNRGRGRGFRSSRRARRRKERAAEVPPKAAKVPPVVAQGGEVGFSNSPCNGLPPSPEAANIPPVSRVPEAPPALASPSPVAPAALPPLVAGPSNVEATPASRSPEAPVEAMGVSGSSAVAIEDRQAASPPADPPQGTQGPRQVDCAACGAALTIDPSLAHLPGGPCPRCQTWIDLSGAVARAWPEPAPVATVVPESSASPNQIPEVNPGPAEGFPESHEWEGPVVPDPQKVAGVAPSAPASVRKRSPSAPSEPVVSMERTPPEPTGTANVVDEHNEASVAERPAQRASASNSEPMGDALAPVELNLSGPKTAPSAGEMKFRRILPRNAASSSTRESWEGSSSSSLRQRVRRRRRRALPAECYVGQASGALDAKGHEVAGQVRRIPFPEKRERGARRIESWLLMACGVVLPLLGGLYAAAHLELPASTAWKFWESESPKEHPEALAQRLKVNESVMNRRAKQAYEAIEGVIEDFFAAPTWDEARRYLSGDHAVEGVDVIAALESFPREDFRGAVVRVMDHARIPRTERFVFTAHVQNGRWADGNPLLTFAVGEERVGERPKLHAQPLYQSWRRSLTEFLETRGAEKDRFYVRLRRGSDSLGIELPRDGGYLQLEIEDWFVAAPWTKEAYVREDSWAGTRLGTSLTRDWSMAVVDLEWRRGPTGDAFVHVARVHSSNWGDFPR